MEAPNRGTFVQHSSLSIQHCRSRRVAVCRNAGEKFDAGFETAVDAMIVAVHPDHAGVEHVAAVGQRLAPAVEADVDAKRVPDLNGGEARQLDAQAGGTDVFSLPPKIPGR